MKAILTATVLQVIERAPQWVRHDLESKDTAIRNRAEETLAAMIAAALEETTPTISASCDSGHEPDGFSGRPASNGDENPGSG